MENKTILPRVVCGMSLQRVLKLALEVLDSIPDDSGIDLDRRQVAIDDLETLLSKVSFE